MKGYYTSREVREVLGVGVGGVWERGTTDLIHGS